MAWACIVLLLLPCVGCGSIRDITKGEGGQRIYGGIRFDAEMIQSPNTTPVALGLLDFPFSLVFDTAFLPITLIFALARSGDPPPKRR